MTSFRHSLGPPVRYFSCLNFNLSGDATWGGLIRILAICIDPTNLWAISSYESLIDEREKSPTKRIKPFTIEHDESNFGL